MIHSFCRLVSFGLLSVLMLTAEALGEPARVYNPHPLGSIHLSVPPQSASPVEPQQLLLELSGSIANTVNREPHQYLIDAQTQDGSLFAAFAPTEDLQLEAHQALIYRGAGDTDHIIEEWHDTFGLPKGPRVRIPENQYVIEGDTREGETFGVSRKGTHFSGLDLSAKYRFYQSADLDLAVLPSLRLPTGADTFGPDNTDLGISGLATYRMSRLTLDFGATYVYFADTELDALRYEKSHFSGFGAVDYAWTDSFALLAALTLESALLENVEQYPDYQVYADFGFRIALCPSSAFEFVVRENPGPDDSTADITLFGSIQMKLFGAQQ